MKNIYLPYILGSDKPIPNLFEGILPYISKSQFNITTYTANSRGVLNKANVKEVFVGDRTTFRGALRFQLKYPFISLRKFDFLHTGGRPPLHHKVTQLTQYRNPEITHLHTLRIDVDPELPTHRVRKKLVEKADRVTAVSHHTAQTAKEVWGISPHVIYNGVDTEVFRPDYTTPDTPLNLDGGNPIILFVGTLEDRKRPHDVIEVAKELEDVTFALIGDGPQMDEIKFRGKNISNLKILGRLPKRKLPPIYANSDGLLFPSLSEGCPNVVMEAMASSLPVIGYEATSMPELVSHMETGYLAEPRDISGLINGVETVLTNKENMGKRARSYIEHHHSFEQISQEYLQLYEEIMDL
jgi:glycosyltransferase involved in cell wall biosynthesis